MVTVARKLARDDVASKRSITSTIPDLFQETMACKRAFHANGVFLDSFFYTCSAIVDSFFFS